MNNYEVGMQCIIIGCKYVEMENNLGKVVELFEFVPKGSTHSVYFGILHNVTEDCWIVRGENLVYPVAPGGVEADRFFVSGEYTGVAQRHLIPLKGDEMQNEIFEDELLEEFV